MKERRKTWTKIFFKVYEKLILQNKSNNFEVSADVKDENSIMKKVKNSWRSIETADNSNRLNILNVALVMEIKIRKVFYSPSNKSFNKTIHDNFYFLQKIAKKTCWITALIFSSSWKFVSRKNRNKRHSSSLPNLISSW